MIPRFQFPTSRAGLGRPDSPPFRSDHPHPCGALLPAIPRWRRPGAWFTDLPSHRALLGWSRGSLGNHPLSMVLLYHTRFSLSSIFQKFPQLKFRNLLSNHIKHQIANHQQRNPVQQKERSHLGNPLSMVLLYHRVSILSRVFKKFF